MMSLSRVARGFLWASVTAWAIALGAKIYDLIVLAGAWGANPPASFALLPYGRSYPVDPGSFFQPLSALLLITSIGAAVSDRRARHANRWWLWLPLIALAVIWAFTPWIFWPMIQAQWEVARGRLAATPAEALSMVHRWFAWDAARIVVIAIGFIASVRALTTEAPSSAP